MEPWYSKKHWEQLCAEYDQLTSKGRWYTWDLSMEIADSQYVPPPRQAVTSDSNPNIRPGIQIHRGTQTCSTLIGNANGEFSCAAAPAKQDRSPNATRRIEGDACHQPDQATSRGHHMAQLQTRAPPVQDLRTFEVRQSGISTPETSNTNQPTHSTLAVQSDATHQHKPSLGVTQVEGRAPSSQQPQPHEIQQRVAPTPVPSNASHFVYDGLTINANLLHQPGPVLVSTRPENQTPSFQVAALDDLSSTLFQPQDWPHESLWSDMDCFEPGSTWGHCQISGPM
ncbi:hypothetical protein Slin14017_G122310 [Septoria linicola]|nr:hypothetical protein Slin14017_G122310 [Septoria linicola]